MGYMVDIIKNQGTILRVKNFGVYILLSTCFKS